MVVGVVLTIAAAYLDTNPEPCIHYCAMRQVHDAVINWGRGRIEL